MTFSADPDAFQITAELRAVGSPARAASEHNYLKSPMEFAGATVPSIRAIVTAWRRAHSGITGDRVTALAADVMGSLVERYPELLPTLDRWATDDDFWIRRSALLALLVPLRRADLTRFPRFAGYADAMLGEREFIIRKAIGWVLRETGKHHPEVVAAWLAPRASRASGVTMRAATKWLQPAQRDVLMAAYQDRNAG